MCSSRTCWYAVLSKRPSSFTRDPKPCQHIDPHTITLAACWTVRSQHSGRNSSPLRRQTYRAPSFPMMTFDSSVKRTDFQSSKVHIYENKQVKKEQNCSGYDSSRPRDVYHPDFMDGRPRYFCVTIRNSLQPSYILKAAIRFGAAAEAAEFEKDARHEANVTTAGGLLYPLVFESLGFISSFTLKTLKGICSKHYQSVGYRFLELSRTY
ncbi:uncharacterized protein LOC134197601 [Corticium candelabrum]|uniref:uncharacterized protein LOC134197601 n=1 Tax=Corticium candelabrum TaxID=121492 RepID=UPI002E25EAB3|nr:uncharacterized protein LOC134197601 [Corticium candelabrum]